MIRAEVSVDLSKLGYLRGSKLNVAIRQAVNKAAVPVRDAVVAAAPAGKEGLLRKSIRIKVRYYRQGASGAWVVIVGPSKAFKRIKRRKAQKRKVAKAARRKAKKKATTTSTTKRRRGKLARKVNKVVKSTTRTATRAAKATTRAAKKIGGFLKRSKLGQAVRKKIKKLRQPPPQVIRPARYAHLQQWGWQAVPGTDFLGRALSSSRAQYEALLVSALRQKIAEIAPS